ncbi:MAG: DUF4375 domain-containing protein [Ruminococcaceae bacterium]|nr:DUF4375 domain-containing protein [Oscillospiraceae bacterium]
MNRFIVATYDTMRPNGAFRSSSAGIEFWQKTGFLRHCNETGFRSIIALISKKFSPVSVIETCKNTYFLHFDKDNNFKSVLLRLCNERNSKNTYIDGSSDTTYTDIEFHILVLEIIGYIAKNIGCKFYVDDSTGYIEHQSKDEFYAYASEYKESIPSTNEELRVQIQKHMTRPLDIYEIISRDTEKNVVGDVYEYFMRKCNWDFSNQFNNYVNSFLLCVIYDEVCQFGIYQYLSSEGQFAHETAEALQLVGAKKSAKALRSAFEFFSDKTVPKIQEERDSLLAELDEDEINCLSKESYYEDISYYLYNYLMKNKEHFLL